jgi:hypothetical protein
MAINKALNHLKQDILSSQARYPDNFASPSGMNALVASCLLLLHFDFEKKLSV